MQGFEFGSVRYNEKVTQFPSREKTMSTEHDHEAHIKKLSAHTLTLLAQLPEEHKPVAHALLKSHPVSKAALHEWLTEHGQPIED